MRQPLLSAFSSLVWVLSLCSLHAVATKEVARNYFSDLGSAEKSEYNQWLNSNFGTSYSRHSFLFSSADANKGAAVFWNIQQDEINFAVAVHATGWMSFGISEAGGMLGSDVVYLESSNPQKLVDSYILESRAAPIVDDCQSWNLIKSTIQDGWMIIEVNRKLDTGDHQDHKIMDDKDLMRAPTRLIAAWGDQPSMSYHGINSGRNAVRLFSDKVGSSEANMAAELMATSDGYFDIRSNNYRIPARDTTYHSACRTFSNDVQQEINVNGNAQVPATLIGAMPVISPETAEYVHHFTVYTQPDCTDFNFARSMIYGWAPGDEGWSLPSNVGFPLFNTQNRQAIYVEIHYNNPEMVSNQIDSSGIRFFYTKEEREERAAILELGDPYVALDGEAIGDGLSQYQFSCAGSCSSTFLAGSSVTILGEYLHMHQTGVRMTNQVFRNNKIVHESRVDVFEFEQQGGFRVPQAPYQVQSGDSFRTTCYYRDGDEFGSSSQEEMCIAFVMYYPAKTTFGYPWLCPFGLDFPVCNQELESSSLSSDSELDRVFGTPGSDCPVSNAPPPTNPPISSPTEAPRTPTALPVTSSPTASETSPPTGKETNVPTARETGVPTNRETDVPSTKETNYPTPESSTNPAPTSKPSSASFSKPPNNGIDIIDDSTFPGTGTSNGGEDSSNASCQLSIWSLFMVPLLVVMYGCNSM